MYNQKTYQESGRATMIHAERTGRKGVSERECSETGMITGMVAYLLSKHPEFRDSLRCLYPEEGDLAIRLAHDVLQSDTPMEVNEPIRLSA